MLLWMLRWGLGKKNLIDIARYLIHGHEQTVNEDLEDLKSFGVSEEYLAPLIEKNAQIKPIELWQENLIAYQWFQEVNDLFEFMPNGFCCGLNLPAIESEARLSHRQYSSEDFKKLRILGKQTRDLLNQ